MHQIQTERQLAKIFTRGIPTRIDKGIIREIVAQLVPTQALKLIIKIAAPRSPALPEHISKTS